MAAIDPDEELSQLVLSSRFDIHSRKLNSNRMTYQAALDEMDTFTNNRLVYRDPGLYDGMPSPLGEKFGRAVEIAEAEVNEDSD